MQFSSKEDIEAPADDVFAMLSEFETFERSAIRRGVEVQRVGDAAAPRPGLAWNVHFTLRGKPRDLVLELVQYDRPNAMRFEADSQGLDATMMLDLLPLSQRRTRISVVLNLKPKTLSSRLLVQSLKLAKANLSKRFKLKIAEFAKSMEERHQRSA